MLSAAELRAERHLQPSSRAVVGCHGGEGQDCHPWYQTPSLSPDISNINSGSWTRNDCKYCTLSDRVWIKYLHCNVTIINAIKQIEYGPYTGNRQHLVQFYVSVRPFLTGSYLWYIVTCICLRHCRMLMYWKMEGTINDSLPSWIQKQAVVQLSVRGHYDQSVNEARVEGSLNTQISIS